MSEGLVGSAGLSARADVASRGFAEAIGRWSDRAQGGRAMTAEDARGAAEELVAMTFVQPILSQMREMNNAAPPFAPGVAERRFGAMWDAEIAQRLVRSEGFGLVDAVARDVLSKARGTVPAPVSTTELSSDETSGTERIDTTG
ncbi:MAG: hypothetical protein ACYTF7_07425 [Planctomycetota bacterium]